MRLANVEAPLLRVDALVHPRDGLVLRGVAVAEELGRLVVEAAEVVVDRRPLCADKTPVNAWPERYAAESPEPPRRRAGRDDGVGTGPSRRRVRRRRAPKKQFCGWSTPDEKTWSMAEFFTK